VYEPLFTRATWSGVPWAAIAPPRATFLGGQVAVELDNGKLELVPDHQVATA
jgi:hypothetical protein